MKLLIATALAAAFLAGCAATPDTNTAPAASSNQLPRHLREKTTGSNIPRGEGDAQTYDRASVEREQARGAMGVTGNLPKER